MFQSTYSNHNQPQTMNMNHEISVSPPETLVKFDAPLFAGIEPPADKAVLPKGANNSGENNAKLEDMLNSMLPPR
jgi:hypothetical protein